MPFPPGIQVTNREAIKKIDFIAQHLTNAMSPQTPVGLASMFHLSRLLVDAVERKVFLGGYKAMGMFLLSTAIMLGYLFVSAKRATLTTL